MTKKTLESLTEQLVENLTETLELRLSPSQQRKVRKDSKDAGLTMSEFCRRRILDNVAAHQEACEQVKAFSSASADLARLGNLLKLSLDQEKATEADIGPVLADLDELKAALKVRAERLKKEFRIR